MNLFKNKTTLTIVVLLLMTQIVFSQQSKIDSLKQVITTTDQDSTRIKTYLKIGDTYEYTLPDTALFYYQKALTIAENSKEQKFISKCSNYIGIVFSSQRNHPKALEYYQKALKINEEIVDKVQIAGNLSNIAVVYKDQGNYNKAKEYFQKALKINEEIGNLSWAAVNYGNMAIIYVIQSNYQKALEYYQKSLQIYVQMGDMSRIANNLRGIGVVYHYQNNYPKGLEYYQKSLQIFEQIEAKPEVAKSLGNIGVAYIDQKNYPKALEYCRKAKEMCQEIGDDFGIALNMGNIGVIYWYQNNYSKAMDYYQKALIVYERLEYKPGIATNYGNMGDVYHQQNNFQKAEELYEKSLNIYIKMGAKVEQARILGNMCSLYNGTHEYELAIEYGNKALKINKEIGIEDAEQYQFLSTSYHALNDKTKAAHYLDTLLNITNNNILLNFTILPESGKELYFSGVEEGYWRYNSFALQNGDEFPSMTGAVYNSTVKNKGLLLKSNTAMRNAIYASKDSILLQAYDNWIVLKNQIATKYANGEDATALINTADSLEGNLVKKSDVFSDFKKTQNIDWKQIQNSLDKNEVAIEFTHFPLLNPDSSFVKFTDQVQYVALVVTKNSSHPQMIPLFKEKELEEIIGEFGGNNYSYINKIYGKQTEANNALYQLVWQPVEEHLKGAKKVYLSPSGLLHKISFSAIAKAQNVYLCDTYDIEVKSSTGKITEPNRKSQKINTAALFGGINYDTENSNRKIWTYLEGTKTEIQNIGNILSNEKLTVHQFSSSEATEKEFKRMASNSNILHIATHGFFYPDPNKVQEEIAKDIEEDEIVFRGATSGFGVNSFVETRNPLMRSGLVFAGANDVWNIQNKNDTIEDGVLTAEEVSSIDLRETDLVVMSACESGLGDIQGSEGVYGLQRAFKMAGVDFIIMSLWQVPDAETEEFMTKFYEKLMEYKEIKQAFAATQKEMRQKYDPYFWAAFVLIE